MKRVQLILSFLLSQRPQVVNVWLALFVISSFTFCLSDFQFSHSKIVSLQQEVGLGAVDLALQKGENKLLKELNLEVAADEDTSSKLAVFLVNKNYQWYPELPQLYPHRIYSRGSLSPPKTAT